MLNYRFLVCGLCLFLWFVYVAIERNAFYTLDEVPIYHILRSFFDPFSDDFLISREFNLIIKKGLKLQSNVKDLTS